MRLKDYINNILEGGNAVECEPIPGNLSMGVYEEFRNMFNKWEMIPIGATGKKTASMVNGDIDTAILEKWDKHNNIIKILEDHNLDYIINPGLQIINVSYPYENKGTKYVQVDIMFSDNLPLTEFRFWSPDYTKNESEYRGVVRTLLFIDIIGSIPTKIPVEYFDQEYDGKYKDVVKKMWKHIVSQSGDVRKVCMDFSGKTKPIAKAKKISHLDEVLLDTPDKFWDFLFDGDKDMSDFNSFESLWGAVNSPKFKYKELIPDIKKRFTSSLDRLNIEVKGINS